MQGRRGILGVRADGSQDDKTVGTINLAGSIVAIGGEVLLSRPVDDGFALVKVPNSRGVRVLANNQLSGRTGRRGSLFVPDLRSYLSSPIGIVQDDLPVEVKLGAISQDIAVPYRGGAVVVFEANVIRALTGPSRRRRQGAGIRHADGDRWRHRVQLAAERERRILFRGSAARRSSRCRQLERPHVPGDDSHAGQGAADDRCRRGDVRGEAAVTPARSLLIAMVAVALLIGARPIAGDEQFPRGLMSAAPRAGGGSCTIETRPLSFGIYDPLAETDVDAIGQIIYTCEAGAVAVAVAVAGALTAAAVAPLPVAVAGRGHEPPSQRASASRWRRASRTRSTTVGWWGPVLSGSSGLQHLSRRDSPHGLGHWRGQHAGTISMRTPRTEHR